VTVLGVNTELICGDDLEKKKVAQIDDKEGAIGGLGKNHE